MSDRGATTTMSLRVVGTTSDARRRLQRPGAFDQAEVLERLDDGRDERLNFVVRACAGIDHLVDQLTDGGFAVTRVQHECALRREHMDLSGASVVDDESLVELGHVDQPATAGKQRSGFDCRSHACVRLSVVLAGREQVIRLLDEVHRDERLDGFPDMNGLVEQ